MMFFNLRQVFATILLSLFDSERGSVPQSNKELLEVAILSFWFSSQNLSEILK